MITYLIDTSTCIPLASDPPLGPVSTPKDVRRWVDAAQYKLTQQGRHRGGLP